MYLEVYVSSFGTWFQKLPAKEKQSLAENVGRSLGYLRHVAKGRKRPSLPLIASIAKHSNGSLTVEQLAAEFSA